jgi:undecaprenyl-diphosphatase
MDIFTAVILGAMQGITEFLPVSSSGHLVLLQKIFGISEPALFFDTMVHVGTLAAVVVVLRKEIWAILRRLFQPLTGYIVIGTIPAVIFAIALKDQIERAFESGRFLGAAFLITSALLAIAQALSRQAGSGSKTANSMNWLDALIIGLFQAVAIVPGISRSGATISGALFRKLDRDFAARFSFLLSIPAICGALVLQLWDIVKSTGTAAGVESVMSGIGMAAVIAGTITAAVTGFFSVKLMIKIIREKSLFGFAIYTGALGVLVILDQLFFHLVF